jgi:SpoVK/Ycf46/Vps4 family AAA+-type ATPase
MIDFISEFFLIEWSSDIVSFIPETLDIYTSAFSQKLSRNFRIFGFTSFFAQRRFLCFMDTFLDGITRPDIDLIIRQKKGIIFWDIWAEILVNAAEIYSINLSSLFNIKEEQDLFLERLISEKKWNWSNEVLDKMSPLMQLLQNGKPTGLSNNSSLFSNSEQIWRRWSVNPYYTYQAKDTDLFVENHPPKSFSHFKLMKYYPPVFEPVGNLVCQIYAGQFVKSISKNLLLVGARGTNKTLLIQALAGETELKLMIDNAKRYALTSKGMAIGMKLLKDVFDALALQAPCLFIIEDIHIIGERRPMLISDDENIKAMENSFGVDQEEIHEKNQVIYQLSRHAIVHYKKPYKGDFSLLIPTNHFALDLFLGSAPPKTRFIAQVPENPLPVQSIEQEISYQNDSTEKSSLTYRKFFTQLQLPKKEIFSPPSTSPFTILLLKEQKKIKPKKIVSEMPWGGLSADQLIQLPKASYSVRVKVALLADIAIRNLSVKLDRITDLLIIIDSVRSHRGFIVIGTTHIPSILDPALRRPGRFDETLTIPALPNLWSRWEILKASVSDFTSTLDLMDLAELFNTLNDTELSTIIGKTKLFLLTKQSFLNKNGNTDLINQLVKSNKIETLWASNLSRFIVSEQIQNPHVNFLNTFGNALKVATSPIIIEPRQMKQNKQTSTSVDSSRFEHSSNTLTTLKQGKANSLVSNLKSFNGALSMFKTSTNCLSISYCQISKWFINSQLIKDRSSYTSLLWSTISTNSLNSSASLFSIDNFNAMLNYPEKNSTFAIYNSTHALKNQLVQLFGGKIGEFFVFYDIKSMTQLLQTNTSPFLVGKNEPNLGQKNHNTFTINPSNSGYENSTVYTQKNYHSFWNDFQSINAWKYSNIVNLSGIDESWQRTSDLIFSIIYKRCLYNKNILIHRLFNIHNLKSLRQPPSPPVSTSFTGAKRYENYKRIEFDLQNRLTFSIHEKIQKHQQQRYIKTLYNKPIQKYFRSELAMYTKNGKSSNFGLTTFENSFREMSLIDINHKLESQNKSSRLSSTYYLFNNRINIRQRFYLINQWWNTQLAEHNAETTFLSEIDWRYMFIEGIGDLWMDFPDTDQHYNPRTRQWMLTSGYWSYWYNFEKVITQEIYYQFLMESFYKAYNVLETSRELLDLTCYDFLTSAVLKEIDFINYLKRFYK